MRTYMWKKLEIALLLALAATLLWGCLLYTSKVPVDYTPVKFVKKPAGARPGMVVYTTYNTLLADPDAALVKKLSVK